MVKLVSFRFQHCLIPVTMLLVEGSSETALFRHLFNHVFGVRNFRNTSAMTVIFFWKYLKLNLDSKNASTNWENNFYFWDNFIWIGFFKFSLLRREYLWPVFNVLTNSPKILHITKRDFFHPNCLNRYQ